LVLTGTTWLRNPARSSSALFSLTSFIITLKALAKFSPWFALKPWGLEHVIVFRNPERVGDRCLDFASRRNPFWVASEVMGTWSQGCQSATLGWN